MAAPYILARTLKEAHDFARDELELPRGHYRVVHSVGTIKAVRGVNLYLVPGWEKRFDRFAMKTALRYCSLSIIDVAEQQAQEPDEPVDSSTSEEEAHAFLTAPKDTPGAATELEDADFDWRPSIPLTSEQLLNPEKPKTARRRRRCKTCDTLHFKGEPCTPEDV